MALVLTVKEGESVYIGTDLLTVSSVFWAGYKCDVLINKCETVNLCIEEWHTIRKGVRVGIGDSTSVRGSANGPRVVLRFDAPKDVKIFREGV